MSLFPFFRREEGQSVVLIDIGSASVAGAYAWISSEHNPVMYYTARIPVRAREGKSTLADMEQALAALVEILVQRGAPAFAQAVGSGHIDRILVSVAAPWQQTDVHNEHMQRETSFRFTSKIMEDMVTKTIQTTPGRVHTDETVIATLLNGYEVDEPFNTWTREADVIVLSSSIDGEAAHAIMTILRRAFHTRHIELTTFAPVAYVVMRDIYPAEQDYLIMDVTGDATYLVLVKSGLLVETVSVPHGLNSLRRAALNAGVDTTAAEPLRAVEEAMLLSTEHNEHFTQQMEDVRAEWIQGLSEALRTLTARFALPRRTFLLADEGACGFLKRLLDSPDFKAIWLSDEPLPVKIIEPGELAPYMTYQGESRGDAFLSLLALYAMRKYEAPIVHDIESRRLPAGKPKEYTNR